MAFKLGVQTYQWLAYADRFGSSFTWKQVCYEAGQAAWVGVELTGGWFEELPPPDEVMAFCESVGVRIVAFTGGIATDEDFESSRRKVEYLREIGGTALMVGPPGSSGVAPQNRAKTLDDFIERAKRFNEVCEGTGVAPGLHNHLWTICESEEEIRHFLDAKAMGWCPDFGHAAAAGADSMALLREYGGTIVHGHLKDALVDESGRWMRFCELGRGNVGLDWAVILHALDEEKYGGWLVVEQDQTTVTPMYDMSMNREYLASLGYEARIRG